MTFRQLLGRITAPHPATTRFEGPFIASATEVDDPCSPPPQWVILHSITDFDLRLIHPRPLVGDELAVQIPLESGEILRVSLAMAESEQQGELYESTAQFLE